MIAPGLQCLTRFGLGRGLAEPVPDDPRRWAADQLAGPDPTPPGTTVTDAFAAVVMDRQDRKDGSPDGKPDRARTIFNAERAAFINTALLTPTPFRERLVWFWANHFTVSIRRGEVAPLAGDYVRTAIRPYVNGRFGDMLLAVMRHPAMLLYLDNAASAGPNSLAASRDRPGGRRGINENLARECLELHTVSPASGYTQADVTAFATVLTGWSVEQVRNPVGYHFAPNLAEPGAKTLMGRTFPEGERGGIDALAWLANHPATHRHLATKLVRHFVADDPPPGAVRRIEGVLRDTGGDLRAASLALLTLDEAWTPLTKLRAPQDYVVAAMRAAELPASVPPDKRPDVPGILAGLGQPPFNAPFPIGWPDTAGEWSGPEALLRRVDWAYGYAGRPELPEPMLVAETALGPLLNPATADDVRRAGSRREAMTLLLGSPEFQRR